MLKAFYPQLRTAVRVEHLSRGCPAPGTADVRKHRHNKANLLSLFISLHESSDITHRELQPSEKLPTLSGPGVQKVAAESAGGGLWCAAISSVQLIRLIISTDHDRLLLRSAPSEVAERRRKSRLPKPNELDMHSLSGCPTSPDVRSSGHAFLPVAGYVSIVRGHFCLPFQWLIIWRWDAFIFIVYSRIYD